MNNYQYIKEELLKQKKSVSWLAKEIGVSKGYISKLINNKVNEPGMTKINAIHSVLKIEFNNKTYQKNAYIAYLNQMSVEKYLYVAKDCLNNNNDIFIIVDNKLASDKEYFNKIHQYTNFSNAKIYIVSESELKKKVSNDYYDNIYCFNHEITTMKNLNIVNIDLIEEHLLSFKEVKSKSVLIISNNDAYLSILLNTIKLMSSFTVDDFSYLNTNSMTNQNYLSLYIVEKVYKNTQELRKYVIGNEYLSVLGKNTQDSFKNNLLNIKEYLNLFDLIIKVDFKHQKSNDIELFNQKMLKLAKTAAIEINSQDILNIAKEIILKIKEHHYEN